MYIVAVFKNRTDALSFYRSITNKSVEAKIVSTPRNIVNSCGVSVKFLSKYRELANYVIRNGNFPSFLGIYSV